MASRQEQTPELPPKKKARRAVAPPTPVQSPERHEESAEEDEVEEPRGQIIAMTASNPPMQIIRDAAGNTTFKRFPKGHPFAEPVQREQVEVVERPTSLPIANPNTTKIVCAWEKGMEIMHLLMEKYKIDKTERNEFHFMADQFPVFRKICNTWLSEEWKYVPLTFSSQKTFGSMMGRFLHHYVQLYSGVTEISNPKWEPTGCVVWEHHCTDDDGELRCLHGLTMIAKEHIIEMDVSSEAGQRALKETPSKAKVMQNRWGRNVVQIRNEDARSCVHDAACAANNFSSKSCGLFYTEGSKARQAFCQIEAFVAASYPYMKRGHKHLLMPVRCECNYLGDCVPRGGRQLCKITPFALTNVEDTGEVTDPVALASIKNPSLLVFQCANPVYRNTRAVNQINCDFKISAPDVLQALQLVRHLWHDNFPEIPLPKFVVPEFKWLSRYQYKNITLPAAHNDMQENPFDF
ncbi:DNA-binding protein [Simian adenovirus 20]|uniref:DNA-binding protein n=1 Tax=Simian adenovirus 20 TaxID=585059 RepID=F6KSV1_9ADEN|nr:DNA-binding protein [Simian adenovirus 20]AEF59056.1 DNA-binding protein [Simian adenovirus 20]